MMRLTRVLERMPKKTAPLTTTLCQATTMLPSKCVNRAAWGANTKTSGRHNKEFEKDGRQDILPPLNSTLNEKEVL